MKTAKEFIEKMKSDEAFAKLVNDGIEAKKAAGAQDYTEALIPVAAELGYEITQEQVEALLAKQSEAIGEEELGKAAGGTSCTFAIASLVVTGAGAIGVTAAGAAGAFGESSSC